MKDMDKLEQAHRRWMASLIPTKDEPYDESMIGLGLVGDEYKSKNVFKRRGEDDETD